MNTANLTKLLFITLCLLSSLSCQKPDGTIIVPLPPIEPPVQPVPPVSQPPGPVVSNRWEFDLNGVHYAGTVDTSWSVRNFPEWSHPDTVLTINGTSEDKLANVHIRMKINRYFYPASTEKPLADVLMVFDTLSTARQVAMQGDLANVKLVIDTFVNGKIIAHFAGSVRIPATTHTNWSSTFAEITNGKFSLEIGKGTNEPKIFSFSHPDFIWKHGYFNLATLESNTLVMEGVAHDGFADQVAKLSIRTGGTIKPGIYEASDGNVGFSFYTPSVYRIVTGSTETMRVTINSVNGNVVQGVFNGTSMDNTLISQGRFFCRVKNYLPQVDSVNKWSFNLNNNSGDFALYGGNMTSASMSQVNGKHLLRLKGESDNGASLFELVLSSDDPFKPGIYSNADFVADHLDSFTFTSPKRQWNDRTTHFYSDRRELMTVRIDQIDAHHIKGAILGMLHRELSPNAISSSTIDNGKFSASF